MISRISIFLIVFSLCSEVSYAAGSALEQCVNDNMLETRKSRDEILPICIEAFKSSNALTEEEYQSKLEEREKIIRLGRELNRPISEVEQELRQRGLFDIKPPEQKLSRPKTVSPPAQNIGKSCRSLDTREYGMVPDGRISTPWYEEDLISRYGPPCHTRIGRNGRKLLQYDKDIYNNGSLFIIVNGRVVEKSRLN
jgi:hypothetical protein